MKTIGLLLMLSLSIQAASRRAPDWVLQASSQTVPPQNAKAPAVVLLHEERLDVDMANCRLMRERGVIRVLQKSQRTLSAFRSYNAKSGRIREFSGWLVRPSGELKVLGKESIVDRSFAGEGTPYTEIRYQQLNPPGELEPGSVFAYEVLEEEKTVFTQYPFAFQNDLPVLRSRFELALPIGWEMKYVTLNHSHVEAQKTGNVSVWEMQNLPYREEEAYAPPLLSTSPRLGVTYFPSQSSRTSALRPLSDWGAVSAWMSELQDPAAIVTEAVRRKASELIANASNETEKIRAISDFVQSTGYVHVAANLTRGGGYVPNSAEAVLSRNYGDCKDKSTLMRALLAAAGIQAYGVGIFWGERSHVRPEWASPSQFNHAIVAIRTNSDIKGPAVIQDPDFGTLLLFDPTDSFTPLGDLPVDQQGSYALIEHGPKGRLIRVTPPAPDFHRQESRAEAVLHADLRLQVQTRQAATGYHGRQIRARFLKEPEQQRRRLIESNLSSLLGAVQVEEIKVSAENTAATLQVGFQVAEFGRVSRNRLVILRPGLLSQGWDYSFRATERKLPVHLTPEYRSSSVMISVPEGWTSDELPEQAIVESKFGTYRGEWSFQPGKLYFEETLTINVTEVPASEYGPLRQFFDSLVSARNSAVVLAAARSPAGSVP